MVWKKVEKVANLLLKFDDAVVALSSYLNCDGTALLPCAGSDSYKIGENLVEYISFKWETA